MQPIFKVSEFNEMINAHLDLLGDIVVEGEISELKVSKDSWLYITLKDESSSVQVFGTLFSNRGWRNLEEGMMVRVTGYARLYPKYGKFSLNAKEIVPAGEGSLKRAFEKLKVLLEKEGLFDEAHKRELPKFPERIGLLTAENSQAYNDFIKVLKNRLGGMKIYFCPIHVQGNDSVSSILRGISYFNENNLSLDAIALIRGGGSMEDLQSFNDERVARAVYASKTPIITGVGHEGDITLVDYVADFRASTPSNCAELLVPERSTVKVEVNRLLKEATDALTLKIQSRRNVLQRANEVFDRVVIAQQSRYSALQHSLMHNCGRIVADIQRYKIDISKDMTHSLAHITQHLQVSQKKLVHFERVLGLLHYENILKRGFSITRSADGVIIRDENDVDDGAVLLTQLHHGTIASIKKYEK